MQTLSKLTLWLFTGLLVAGLLATVLLLLYALLFDGPWFLFFWVAGLSLVLVIAIKLLALGCLEDQQQLCVAALISELRAGAFGWTWQVLGVVSLVLLCKALFFGASWWNFFICLIASTVCKCITQFSMVTAEGAMFKRELVKAGMTKEQARSAWIAQMQEIMDQPEPPA